VIAPCAIDKAASERQLIGAAVIFAQHLNRLTRRRFSLAIELGQTPFARCHSRIPLKRTARAIEGKTSTRECGFSVVSFLSRTDFAQFDVISGIWMRTFMTGRIVLVSGIVLASCILASTPVRAQDVPGIEICTVEKTMERRTSCLQSNVDFLQKTIAKLGADHQQKLDAANRQIEGLKSTVAGLQKIVDDLQAAQKKAAEDQKKKVDAPAAKDAPPVAKDGAK
jgi:hypothetical protein